MVILHPDVLEFLQFLPPLFLGLLELEIDGFLLLLLAFHLRLLLAIPHIQFGLVLLDLIEFLFVLLLHLNADLVLELVLLLHGLVVLLLLLFFFGQASALLFDQLLHLLVDHLLLFQVFTPGLALELAAIHHLRF